MAHPTINAGKFTFICTSSNALCKRRVRTGKVYEKVFPQLFCVVQNLHRRRNYNFMETGELEGSLRVYEINAKSNFLFL